MYRILVLAAFVLIGAAGLAAGMALRPLPAPPKTIEIHESSQTAAPIDRAQLASLIRGVMREEMQRSAPATPTRVEKEPATPPQEPTVEQLEARDHGQRIIASAQSAGRWTDEDREQLHAVLRQLNHAERQELLHALLPAINRQEIKVDTIGPLL